MGLHSQLMHMELTHTTKDSTCFSSTLINRHFEDSNMCTSFKQNRIILNEHICKSIWESAKLSMLLLKSYDFLKWPNILFTIWDYWMLYGKVWNTWGMHGEHTIHVKYHGEHNWELGELGERDWEQKEHMFHGGHHG